VDDLARLPGDVSLAATLGSGSGSDWGRFPPGAIVAGRLRTSPRSDALAWVRSTAQTTNGIALMFAVLPRYGLLALIVTFYTFLLIEAFPLTTDLARPYAGASILLLAGVAGLSMFGLYASRGDEPLFGRTLLD
jgi:hypothetical protein